MNDKVIVITGASSGIGAALAEVIAGRGPRGLVELRAEYPEIHISTVMPGVVATAFGANALHGGPDSSALPMAQPVGEVATAIADLIEHPRAELYTRPELAQLVARYYSAEDVAAIEAAPPFTMMPRR